MANVKVAIYCLNYVNLKWPALLESVYLVFISTQLHYMHSIALNINWKRSRMSRYNIKKSFFSCFVWNILNYRRREHRMEDRLTFLQCERYIILMILTSNFNLSVAEGKITFFLIEINSIIFLGQQQRYIEFRRNDSEISRRRRFYVWLLHSQIVFF